jgi:putative transposase
LELLRDAVARYGCLVHAYVLMTNHVHLLVTPETSQSVPSALQAVGRSYVRYINSEYGRSGTLWEGRYKSALVDSERYLLACSRYIELNPVRAGMVATPAAYRWSSYGRNGLGQLDELVSSHSVYKGLGDSGEERRISYRALFAGHADVAEAGEIRQATARDSILGDDRFRKEIEEALGRRVAKYEHGGDRKSRRFRGIGHQC